jgi:mono/diheme cytochrome c family protein
MRTPLSLTFSVLIVLTAGAQAAPDGGAAKVVGPPEVAWKDMNKDQRMKFMKAAVMPKMKVVFQTFDPKKFEKVNCATCHGKDGKDRDFKMPNPNADIHALPDNPEGFKALMAKKADWPKYAKFMSETVEPTLFGQLLQVPVFNPKKPDPAAYGCAKCHTLKHDLKD